MYRCGPPHAFWPTSKSLQLLISVALGSPIIAFMLAIDGAKVAGSELINAS